MIVNNQISHAIIVFSAFLAVISGLQYLKYRTRTTSWAGYFLFSLAGELLCFAFQLLKAPDINPLYLFTSQVVFFFLFVIFWSMFIIAMAGFSKRKNLWIVVSIVVSSFSVMFLFQGESLPFSWNLDLLTEMDASVFRIETVFGQSGRITLALFYGVGFVSTIFLFRYLLGANEKHKNLVFPMVLGNLFFYALSILEHAGFDPFEPVHLTQLGLVLLSFAFFFFAVIWRFGGILPLSRESVFEELRDGVLLLDWQNNVIELNQSAQRILDLERGNVIRKPLSQVWPTGGKIIEANRGKDFITEETVLSLDNQEHTFGVDVSRLFGINQSLMGSMVVLRNITSRERMAVVLSEQSSELQRTNSILATLAEVNIRIHQTTDLSKINTILGNELKKRGLVCFIALFDAGSDELTIKYISSNSEVFARIEKLIGRNVVGFQLDRGQFARLYRILDLNEIKLKRVYPSFLGETRGKISTSLLMKAITMLGVEMDSAVLALPLVTRNKTLGVIGVWGGEIRESDVVPFRLFADQVANVMDRAALYEKEIQRSTELSRVNNLTIALSEVASVISATSNSSVVLNALGSELKKSGLDCMVGRIDMEKEVAYLSYLSFNPELLHRIEKIIAMKLENFPVPKKYWPGSKIIDEQEPAWYSGARQIFRGLFVKLPGKAVSKALDLLNIRDEDYVCFLPLIQNTVTVGVLAIWGAELREEDNAILGVFSSQVASIIQNISSLEHQVQRTDELKRTNAMVIALSRVASQLNTISDLEKVFRTLGEELLTVEVNCMVGILNNSRDALIMEYISMAPAAMKLTSKHGKVFPEKILIPKKLWPSEDVVLKGIPYWDEDPVDSTKQMFPFMPKAIFKKAYQLTGLGDDGTICYLPMINGEEVIGVLSMWGADLRREDLPALSVFANQVAIAINNIRLFNQAQKEIDERKQAEAGIRIALEDKEVLLKEVHHRVKNNLQVISSLLNLQSSQIDDSKTVDILRESQNRVRSMALIHEKLYQSSDLARIDFDAYLRSLVSSLRQTYRVENEMVVVEVAAEDIALGIDTAIPCGLIVNELVSNSLKYAFSKAVDGKVIVTCEKPGADQYKLIVQDNGIGLPDGFKPGEGNSLGLKLVNSLVRQLDGELSVKNHQGARFEIEFSELKAD